MVSVFDRRVLFSGAVRYTDDEAIKQQSHQLQTTDIKDFLNGSRLKSDIVLVCLSHRWNMASWQLSNNLGRLRCAMDALKAAHQSADDSSNAVEDNEACLESSLAEQLKQLMSNKLKSLQVDFVIIEQDESVDFCENLAILPGVPVLLLYLKGILVNLSLTPGQRQVGWIGSADMAQLVNVIGRGADFIHSSKQRIEQNSIIQLHDK